MPEATSCAAGRVTRFGIWPRAKCLVCATLYFGPFDGAVLQVSSDTLVACSRLSCAGLWVVSEEDKGTFAVLRSSARSKAGNTKTKVPLSLLGGE
jgi:hypothetical protein